MTCLLGTIGGGCCYLAGFPAAWLSGAMVAVSIAALLKVPTHMPNRIRDGAFVVMGISMGAGVQPEVIARIGEWPVSLFGLALVVVGVTLAGFLVLRFVAGWSAETAYFGAIPGALSYVIALASERSADLPRIAASQSMRLFVLVAVLPMVISANSPQIGAGAAIGGEPPFVDLLIGGPFCLLASWIAVRLRVPGGWMTGAFFTSAFFNASGLLHVGLSGALLVPCYIILGAMIGCRFASMTMAGFLNLLWGSLGAFAAGFSVAALGAYGVSIVLDIPFGQVLLAYAPGGLEVMTFLSFMLDMDPAFVAVHQLVRYIGMVLVLPFVTIWLFGRDPARPGGIDVDASEVKVTQVAAKPPVNL